MKEPICTVKDIYITPFWNTIHKENCLLQYEFGDHGEHPVYYTWEEISDLKIKHIDALLECVFKLNLAPFGMESHILPVINFNNDCFNWLFYKLDEANKIVGIEGYMDSAGTTLLSDDVEALLAKNHIRYNEESTTKKYKGKTLTIIKNEDAPLLKQLTQKEVDEFMSTQEMEDEIDDWNDPMNYFIAFDNDNKAIPQNDQYDLMKIYGKFSNFKNYFGAVPKRNQNCFEVPSVNGKEMPFVGQYNDTMFGGYDIYCFVFYDKETKTVAIFQQTT